MEQKCGEYGGGNNEESEVEEQRKKYVKDETKKIWKTRGEYGEILME
jgi:hypothetical protein